MNKKTSSQKTILVAGGMGYIGSHTIIEIFRKTNYQIISIDNFINSHPITQKRIEKITSQKIINYKVDLCDLNKLKKILQNSPPIYAIIHFAALKSVEESVEKPLLYYNNNLTSLLNLLECCNLFKIKYFIFSSSCSLYGNLNSKLLPVDEETPPQPTQSPYAHTKLISEEIIKNTLKNNKKYPIFATSLRYFNPAGADPSSLIGEFPSSQVKNLVNVITQTALGKIKSTQIFGNDYSTRDGTCIRDYVHVNDIAIAHILAIKYLEKVKTNKKSFYDVFNLGTGKGITVLEMVKAFEKISQQKLNYKFVKRRPGDVMSIYSNCSKAKKILKWIPTYSIEKMLETAWKWELNLANKNQKFKK